jgi:hypothetical protein
MSSRAFTAVRLPIMCSNSTDGSHAESKRLTRRVTAEPVQSNSNGPERSEGAQGELREGSAFACSQQDTADASLRSADRYPFSSASAYVGWTYGYSRLFRVSRFAELPGSLDLAYQLRKDRPSKPRKSSTLVSRTHCGAYPKSGSHFFPLDVTQKALNRGMFSGRILPIVTTKQERRRRLPAMLRENGLITKEHATGRARSPYCRDVGSRLSRCRASRNDFSRAAAAHATPGGSSNWGDSPRT